jgi:predicted DNA-binding transcriptional regulator AlpA
MTIETGVHPLLTVREAAALARCSESTIRRALKAGRLQAAFTLQPQQGTGPDSGASKAQGSPQSEPTAPEPTMSVREVAAMARCSTSTVYRAIKSGKLASVQHPVMHLDAGALWTWLVAREEGKVALSSATESTH